MLLLKITIQNSINGKVTSDCVKNALRQIGGEDYNLPKGNLVKMSYNLGYHNIGFTNTAKRMLKHYQQLGGRWPEQYTHYKNTRSSPDERERAEASKNLVDEINRLSSELDINQPVDLANFLSQRHNMDELADWVLNNLDRNKSKLSASGHTSQMQNRLPKFSTTPENFKQLKLVKSTLIKSLSDGNFNEDDDDDSDFSPHDDSESESDIESYRLPVHAGAHTLRTHGRTGHGARCGSGARAVL